MGDECLDCLKDLKRFLKQDHLHGDHQAVLLALGEWKIMSKDLIPIFLLNCQGRTQDQELLCNACGSRVCILYSGSGIVCTHDVASDGPGRRVCHASGISVGVQAVVSTDACCYGVGDIDDASLVASVSFVLESEVCRDRTLRENAMLRLMLVIVRNLLDIKDPEMPFTASKDDAYRANMQDELIKQLHASGFLRLLTACAACCDEPHVSDLKMSVLEILYLLFSKCSVKQLLGPPVVIQKSVQPTTTRLPGRHSRFGGTLKESTIVRTLMMA
jgi:hypothetical protein